MAGQSLYSIGTYNVSGDTLDISDNIFGDLEDAINTINNEMGHRLRELFGVELSVESFFTENKNDKYEHRFHTRENNVLELVKRSWNIDIYLEEVKKGYLYNSSRKSHSMKFFIKKHDSLLLSEEEESDFSLIKVKDILGITEILDNDSSKESPCNDKKEREYNEKYSFKSCKITPIENIENKSFEEVLDELRTRFM